ncbi:pantoate--beta-alanine ligase [Candidatus Sororendozoicomonas aggregata]|uniref:pantoate--beta-alanine ligase n=1 Tax=Candidatus Sororendozoicomonas aggregata TaxID=3073239 RepID=UPI002ED0EF6B
MKIINTIADIQHYVAAVKATGKRVAFVPTMGNLHKGHLSLVKQAKLLADVVIVSIYVNPLQFGADEDFDAYPRTMEQDCEQLIAYNTDVLYAAASDEIYPEGSEKHTHVSVDILDCMHCSNTRPAFFRGVATVVAKLFNIVRPDVAVFGEKDYQQLTIVKKMVSDMCIPVEVIGAPTVREKSGLAMSSRNNYLTDTERQHIAPAVYRTLLQAREAIVAGERDYQAVRARAFASLSEAGIKPDYFNVSHPLTLQPAEPDEKDLVILAAGYLGKARLIDNLYFSI